MQAQAIFRPDVRDSCSMLIGANRLAKRMFLKASKTPWWNGRSGKKCTRKGPRCDSKSLMRRHM